MGKDDLWWRPLNGAAERRRPDQIYLSPDDGTDIQISFQALNGMHLCMLMKHSKPFYISAAVIILILKSVSVAGQSQFVVMFTFYPNRAVKSTEVFLTFQTNVVAL